MTLDNLILGAEVVCGLLCAAIFVIAVTGRAGFSDWELSNLKRAAITSGIGVLAMCVLIIWQFS